MLNPIFRGLAMKLIWLSLIMFAAAVSASASLAADYSVEDNKIFIHGTIEAGDYQRFRDFVLSDENFSAMQDVLLNSPGGDIIEALKFANLFHKSFARTGVVQRCYGACFIAWAGGVERNLAGVAELGIYRPPTKEIRQAIQKADGLISPAAADLGKYLGQLGIPRPLIDKINEANPTGMLTLDAIDVKSEGWYSALTYQPAYLDTAERACGKSPDPYPGEDARDKPRDPQTAAKISKWLACMNKLRLENRVLFAKKDLEALDAGKPSLLMTANRRSEAQALFK